MITNKMATADMAPTTGSTLERISIGYLILCVRVLIKKRVQYYTLMENFIFLLKLFIHKTAKMLSDQLIISGICIGGTRENEAIQAIYDNFSYTLQKFISLNLTQLLFGKR